MAQVDKITYNAQFNNSGGGYFPTNNTQAIASSSMRKLAEDNKDSLFFLKDDAYGGAKGLAPGITTIAGLKTIVTVGLTPTGQYVLFRDTAAGNVLRVYELVAGTDAESSPTVIRPADYAVSTNEKVWKLANITTTITVTPVWDWSANSNMPPVSTAEGQIWITKGDYEDDGFVITDGSFLIAKEAGASVIDPDPGISEYWIKP